MKKFNKILTVLLSIPLLIGCSPKPTPDPGPNPPIPPEPVDPLDYGEWTVDQKAIFASHLYGYEVLCLQNMTVVWNDVVEYISIEKSNVTEEVFEAYVDKNVELGFSKEEGPYINSYVLSMDYEYAGATKAIELDIILSDGMMRTVCYDPYTYEWPTQIVENYIHDYYSPQPSVGIPSLEGYRYAVDESDLVMHKALTVYVGTQTNSEDTYAAALEKEGFIVSVEKNKDGYYAAYDIDELIVVFFAYSSKTKLLEISMRHYPKWPASEVAYYVDQMSTKGTVVPEVPGCDYYELIDSAWDHHGYMFVLCETDNNLEQSYATKLNETYTVYKTNVNLNGNYWAVSDNSDVLVQFKYIVTESTTGGDAYKHFDVMFEPYYAHNHTKISEGLQLICPGTETTIPAYPGYGEKITIPDSNAYMDIMIQSCTLSSLSDYFGTLKDAGWFTYTSNPDTLECVAFSPSGDIKLSSYLLDGRIYLKLKGIPDTWPTEGIAEICVSQSIMNPIVPKFKGATEFDYENTEKYHDVVCYVEPGCEQYLADYYNEHLLADGWSTKVSSGITYYITTGTNIALRAYCDSVGSGYVYIEICNQYKL